MRTYKNTNLAKRFLYYILTENVHYIEYQSHMMRDKDTKYRNYNSYINYIEKTIRNHRYKLERACLTIKCDKNFNDFVLILIKLFSDSINILTCISHEWVTKIYNKFIYNPIMKKMDKILPDMDPILRTYLNNTTHKIYKLLMAIISRKSIKILNRYLLSSKNSKPNESYKLALLFACAYAENELDPDHIKSKCYIKSRNNSVLVRTGYTPNINDFIETILEDTISYYGFIEAANMAEKNGNYNIAIMIKNTYMYTHELYSKVTEI